MFKNVDYTPDWCGNFDGGTRSKNSRCGSKASLIGMCQSLEEIEFCFSESRKPGKALHMNSTRVERDLLKNLYGNKRVQSRNFQARADLS